MAADHAWSGLKPSKARVAVPEQPLHQVGSTSLHGAEWAPFGSDVELSMSLLEPQHQPWLAHGPSASATGRKHRPLVPDMWRSHDTAGSSQHEAADHRQGWTRRSSAPSTCVVHQGHYRFDSSPCSELKLDEEMTMFETQITRTVSGRLFKLTSPSQDTPSSSTPVVVPAIAAASSDQKSYSSEFVGNDQRLKRKRSYESDMQGGTGGWVHPFTLLVCKGLTLSDIGGLGRIIIPKKDAESAAFPRIESKEGTVLEMEDFTASKRWYFRFKYWINNKSRMYVLENAGEFVKYHSLKEHDMFIVYEDGCKKLVVRGQKKSTDKWDPLLEFSEGSILQSSASGRLLPATKDELGSQKITGMENIRGHL